MRLHIEIAPVAHLPPIYPVLIGQQGPAKDVGVSDVAVTQTNFEDTPVNLTAQLTATGYKGQTIVAQLFQTSDPINELIRVKNIPFRVIGVLERKGANIVGEDQDDVVLIPYSTVKKRLQGSTFDNVGAVMTRKVMTCTEADTIASLMERMTTGKFRHLPVVEQGKLVGVISIGDAVKFRVEEIEGESNALREYIATA